MCRMQFLLFGYFHSIRPPPECINKGEISVDYQSLMTAMRRLSLEAGDAIMEIYGQDDFSVEAKSDDSPVTAADKAADEIIYKGLSAEFPDMMLVTEEQASSHGLKGDTFLIVDPLDGTKEFIHRRGDFTVNIALVENGRPTRGVVYAPAKGRMFYTLADGTSVEEIGPFDKAAAGETKEIRVSDSDNSALLVVASKSHRDEATDAYINKYSVADMKSAGSSLKFCLIATGEADLYPRLGRTMEWDTAAGHAVLEGAGGQVLRFDDQTPLTYGKDDFANPFFIATSPKVALKSA